MLKLCRFVWVFWVAGVGCSVGLSSTRAYAFGGVWTAPGGRLSQTAEQVIFVDSPGERVTAIVQLDYDDHDGPAQELSWLIPVSGEPAVGVSSSVIFQRLRPVTDPHYWMEVTDPCSERDAGANAELGSVDEEEGSPARVKIVDRGVTGPYDYMTLSVDPEGDDPVAAASAALSQHAYAFSEQDIQRLAPYLRDGDNLLAIKLRTGKGTGALRPLAITFDSELPSLPIRPTAVAARDDMPLYVWVFGPSQAIPDNYGSLVINDALLDWQSVRTFPVGTLPANGAGSFGPILPKPSNYDALVTRAADQAEGLGFVTEYAGPAAHIRGLVWTEVDAQSVEFIDTQHYGDGIDAAIVAIEAFRGWDGMREVIEESVKLPEGTSVSDFNADPGAYRGLAEVDSDMFLKQLKTKVIDPVRNTAELLSQAPYVTRLFTTLSADEMTRDPVFNYNAELAMISNVHIAKQLVQCTLADGDDPTQAARRWRVELPQGGAVVGEGDGDWPLSLDSMPANLKVVALSTTGSGQLVEDNSRSIGRALYEASGTNGTGAAIVHASPNGLLIGGDQSVVPYVRAATNRHPTPLDDADDLDDVRRHQRRDRCNVTYVAAGDGHSSCAFLLWLAAATLWRHRRRQRRATALATQPRRPPATWNWTLLRACAAFGLIAGCREEPSALVDDAGSQVAQASGALTRDELRDPETCKGCHPKHYREWSGSMHAFASRDPVFRAMNARGQRETQGELGNFCVNCHAPMAVRDKLTTDGLNLDELPQGDRGITCYFCHNVSTVDGTHNSQLTLAYDDVLRGPLEDPIETPAHHTVQSKLFDENAPESSAMCGSCHDIVMPKGVAIERTFMEFQQGLFSKSATGSPPQFGTCISCHMQGTKARAASTADAPERIVHEHFWPGIDVALTDFPHREAMRSAIEDCQLGSQSISYFSLEVTPPDLFTFLIETNAGHNQPSGASQDRRMWLEFLAYDEDDNLIEEASSGNIAEGEVEEWPEGHPRHDPQLVIFRDLIFDEAGEPVHMFWDAAKSSAYPTGYESVALPVASTTYVEGRHAVVKQLRASGPKGLPARITARLRIRPIGMDVLNDLVDSGDLEREVAEQMPTLNFGATIEWTRQDGTLRPIYADVKKDCNKYLCMLDPNAPRCE